MAKKSVALIEIIVHEPGCGCFDGEPAPGGSTGHQKPVTVSPEAWSRNWDQSFPEANQTPAYLRKAGGGMNN